MGIDIESHGSLGEVALVYQNQNQNLRYYTRTGVVNNNYNAT